MQNITTEQKKKVLNQITETEDFKTLVNNTLELKLKYYNLLNKILPTMYIGKHELPKEYILNYFYQSMLMDKYDDENVVYFIRNQYTGLLKIGKTSNLKRRIKEIERCFTFLGLDVQKMTIEAISFCPFGMKNDQVEKFYHELFQDKRKNGEWFDISYDELANTLFYDYFINDTMIVIEDVYDFRDGTKFIHLEENNDVETLRKNIQNDLIEKVSKELHIPENMFDLLKVKEETTSSEEMYNYITNLTKDSYNLDDKIRCRIEHILNF